MAKAKQQEAGIGHNSGDDTQTVADEQIRSYVERVEKLEEEKKSIQDDIKDVYAEAKGNGFNVKVLRAVVQRRKADKDDLAEFDAMLEIYEGIFG